MQNFGIHLLEARERRGLSQRQLASAVDIHQGNISEFEQGKRLPTPELWLKLAAVLRVSLQWFLTGDNQPGLELADIAFQLHDLGVGDLHVENARVPGAYRPAEEVVALALAGMTPPARIVEAMPAVLAWNSCNSYLLRTYARIHGKRVEHRIAWLADIAITIERTQGFPGGCPAVRVLESYIQHVKPPEAVDTLGYSASDAPLPPVSLRWKMHYPAALGVFRARAEHLHNLRAGAKGGRHA